MNGIKNKILFNTISKPKYDQTNPWDVLKFFDELKKTTLKSLESINNVISLGGGGFINAKIRKEVLKNNFSFWLNCDTQTLLNRIKNSKKRPIAFNLSDSELTELIAKRTKIYSKAQFIVDCHKLSKTEIVKTKI